MRAYFGYLDDLRPEEFCEESRELFLKLKANCKGILSRVISNPPTHSAALAPTEFAHYKINGITGRKIAEMIVRLCRQAEGEEPARELSGGQSAAEIISVAAEKVRLLNSEEPKPK